MTQEEKQLLLKDLSARLPYKVIVHICSRGENAVRDVILSEDNITNAFEVPEGWWKEIKPYLRPISSMTKEEEKEYNELYYDAPQFKDGWRDAKYLEGLHVDWLNKNMFDYRGLIPKGLAIEVTKENNPYKE